jgi:hypothetical protein
MKKALPKDLTKITEPQYRAIVCHLAQRPLNQLRRQQLAIQKQERQARRAQNTTALDNLYVMDRIATDALFEHQFGPSICRRPRR